MTLTLNGAQKRDLRLALVSAFPSWNELRRLTNDQLDLNLAEIAAQGTGIVDNAFDLIEWIALHRSCDPRIKRPTYNQAIPISPIAARPKVSAALES